MASICWASIGLVFLLVFPFNSQLLSPIILLAALPYFVAMASDFKRLGYKRTDVFRVYAFNLILLPVNLAGTLQVAAAGRRQGRRSRSPARRRSQDRTAAPALFVLAAYLIALFSFWTLANDVRDAELEQRRLRAGQRRAHDLRDRGLHRGAQLRRRRRRRARGTGSASRSRSEAPARRGRRAAPADHWESVLYFGPDHTDSPAVSGVAVVSAPGPRRGDTRARLRT